ncbi:MAG: hypothetical protein J5965_02380 [Aeriscardovia sp.]|nr:hypothetical protein [Aeriscardovia sp.]
MMPLNFAVYFQLSTPTFQALVFKARAQLKQVFTDVCYFSQQSPSAIDCKTENN